MVAEPAPAPRISEQDAKAMVDSLVSAATGAAMLDLPPTIYLAMAQNLAREKAKVAAALMTPNGGVQRRPAPKDSDPQDGRGPSAATTC